MVPQFSKRSSKVLIALAGCATLLSAVLPGTAMAATAAPPPPIPQTGDSCSLQYIGAQECTEVVGSGLKITSISGTFKNHAQNPVYDIYIDFYGPGGKYITATATTPEVGANSQYGPFVWHNPNPTVNMPAGDYCTEGASPGIAGGTADCIDVH
jgi:hypothetical protein